MATRRRKRLTDESKSKAQLRGTRKNADDSFITSWWVYLISLSFFFFALVGVFVFTFSLLLTNFLQQLQKQQQKVQCFAIFVGGC